jgi:Major Facilitator Superfamily
MGNVILGRQPRIAGANATMTRYLVLRSRPNAGFPMHGSRARRSSPLKRCKAFWPAGVLLFGIASLACAVAPTLILLLLARFVRGAGAAMLMPNSLAILGQSFSGEAKGRAIGIWAATGAAAGAIGPVHGGWLIDAGSWRLAFLINVPLSAAAIVPKRIRTKKTATEAATRATPDDEDAHRARKATANRILTVLKAVGGGKRARRNCAGGDLPHPASYPRLASRDGGGADGGDCRPARPCRHPHDREALRPSGAELRRANNPGEFSSTQSVRGTSGYSFEEARCSVMHSTEEPATPASRT